MYFVLNLSQLEDGTFESYFSDQPFKTEEAAEQHMRCLAATHTPDVDDEVAFEYIVIETRLASREEPI